MSFERDIRDFGQNLYKKLTRFLIKSLKLLSKYLINMTKLVEKFVQNLRKFEKKNCDIEPKTLKNLPKY